MTTTIYQADGSFVVVADPTPAVPPIPQEIDSWRGKLVLARTPGKAAGPTLFDEAKALVDAAPAEDQALWDRPLWHRDSEQLLALATAAGLSSDEVDDLFRAAPGAN